MMQGRRGFLKALAMAPAVLPVASKAAAHKMGLHSVTSASADDFCSGYAEPIGSDGDWARRALKEMMSERAVRERNEQAKRMATVLDADLAAHCSMSPSVAYGIQVKRNYKRMTEDQKRWYLLEIENSVKQTMGIG